MYHKPSLGFALTDSCPPNMPKLASFALHAIQRAAKISATILREQPTQPYLDNFGSRFPCAYCNRLLLTEAGRNRHIASSPSCSALQSWAEKRKELAALLGTTLAAQNHVLDESSTDEIPHRLAPPLDLPEPEAGTWAPPMQSNCEHPPHTNAGMPPQCENQNATCPMPELLLKDGVYVECFPNKLAGAPISEEHAYRANPQAYLSSCGVLADLEHFEVAALLMTTGLSNEERTRHLKSRKVSGDGH